MQASLWPELLCDRVFLNTCQYSLDMFFILHMHIYFSISNCLYTAEKHPEFLKVRNTCQRPLTLKALSLDLKLSES